MQPFFFTNRSLDSGIIISRATSEIQERSTKMPFLNRQRVIASLSVACTTSALALLFDPAIILTFPGAVLTMVLFGRIAVGSRYPRIILNVVATSILWYLGAALWTWGNNNPKHPAPLATRALLIFWLILLIPWMAFGPLSAMVFEGGASTGAYIFFWSTITYPVSVALALVLRKWFSFAVILPVLNFAACFASPVGPK